MEQYDEGDRYFAVPVKKSYAIFTFKPYWHITKIFDSLNIPYEMYTERKDILKGKKYRALKCNQQRPTKYKVLTECDVPLPIFFFTADIIDKVFDAYNVKYEKDGGKLWRKGT